MLELPPQVFDLQLADPVFLFLFLQLLGEHPQLVLGLLDLPVHLSLFLPLPRLLLLEHLGQLLLPLLQLLHFLLPVSLGVDVVKAVSRRLFLPLPDLLHVLPVLVFVRGRRCFLVFPCDLISFLLLLQLSDFFLPDAELVEQDI